MIEEHVNALHQNFFADTSNSLVDFHKNKYKLFDHQDFQEIFNKIINENKVVEYYLLDGTGSFLFLDASAKNQIWLIIRTKEGMEKLRNKEGSMAEAKDWGSINFEPFDEEKNFYFTVLKNDEDFKNDQSEIKSYANFLEK